MADRASIRARIAALRSKTTRNGCTEAEAISAAELAAKLMREHGIPDDDMEEAESAEKAVASTWRDQVTATVGRCTNTAAMVFPGRRVIFVGRPPSPEIAAYLREVVNRAVAGEIAAFKKGKFYRQRRSIRTKRQAVADFTQGLVDRICGRLRDMFRASIDPALFLAAQNARDARYPDGSEVDIKRRDARYDEAVSAGRKAGERIPLNHGVAGGRAQSKPVKPPVPKLKAPPRQGSLF